MMSFRDKASFGKRQEFIVFAELLKRGFDIYMTLVDDRGIDCVIRLDEKRYLDIQIKASSKSSEQWNLFAPLDFVPRSNLYFIFYTEKNNTFWIIPSFDVAKLASENTKGKYEGKRNLSLPTTDSGLKGKAFDGFKNDRGFELLRHFGSSETEQPGN